MTRLLIVGKNHEIPRAAFTLRDAYSSMSLGSAASGTRHHPEKVNQALIPNGGGPNSAPARRQREEVHHG